MTQADNELLHPVSHGNRRRTAEPLHRYALGHQSETCFARMGVEQANPILSVIPANFGANQRELLVFLETLGRGFDRRRRRA